MATLRSSFLEAVPKKTFWDLNTDGDTQKCCSGRPRSLTDGCFVNFEHEESLSNQLETASTDRSSSGLANSDSSSVGRSSDSWSSVDTDDEQPPQAPPGSWDGCETHSAVHFGSSWTTLIVKQLPEGLTQQSILLFLQSLGLRDSMDFFYAPFNFRKDELFGYCFLNFMDHECAKAAARLLRQTPWPGQGCKAVQVAWSESYQGLAAQIERYRNCPVMHRLVSDMCKPMLFIGGRQVAFPSPTTVVQPPRTMMKAGNA